MYRAMLASLVAVGMVLTCGSIRSTATADDKTTKDKVSAPESK